MKVKLEIYNDIYIEVWKDILHMYNLNCNKEFFDTFIKGKADNTYLNKVISEERICEISKTKDTLFIEKFKKSKSNILLDGVSIWMISIIHYVYFHFLYIFGLIVK